MSCDHCTGEKTENRTQNPGCSQLWKPSRPCSKAKGASPYLPYFPHHCGIWGTPGTDPWPTSFLSRAENLGAKALACHFLGHSPSDLLRGLVSVEMPAAHRFPGLELSFPLLARLRRRLYTVSVGLGVGVSPAGHWVSSSASALY